MMEASYNDALSPQKDAGKGGWRIVRSARPGVKRRGRHPENALSADFVREVGEAGRYCDGHGLYLEVQPSGSRSWVQRLVVRGRRREMGLGGFPLVSLDEARAKAFANRKLARAGGDPLAGARGAGRGAGAGGGGGWRAGAVRSRGDAGTQIELPLGGGAVRPAGRGPVPLRSGDGRVPGALGFLAAETVDRGRGATPTFAVAAERVWTQMRPGWRNRKYGRDWLAGLARYAFPRIGGMPVSDVTSADIIEMLGPVWHARPTTARRLRQRVGAVMDWAVAMEYRPDNPCERIGPVLGRQQHLVEHMRALPHAEVAGAVAAVRASGARPVVKLAFEFMVLTAARSGEVRGAPWAEMDPAGGVWTVPAGRMKAKREHRVPLCRRAVDVLDAARALAAGGRGPRARSGPKLVFPTARGGVLKDMALSGLLKGLGVAAVPHGFRSSFRDWAAEETDHPREVVEAALAHTVRNPVEAAYARSDLFGRRRKLMDDWAAYLGRG